MRRKLARTVSLLKQSKKIKDGSLIDLITSDQRNIETFFHIYRNGLLYW